MYVAHFYCLHSIVKYSDPQSDFDVDGGGNVS